MPVATEAPRHAQRWNERNVLDEVHHCPSQGPVEIDFSASPAKTRQAIQEAQGRSSHERQRCPCAALLETLQDPRLQILPHDVQRVAGSRSLHDFAQVLFHRSWYSSASARAREATLPANRSTLRPLKRRAIVVSRSKSTESRCCRRSSRAKAGSPE